MRTGWLLVLACLASMAQAHEFWLVPDRFAGPPGAEVTLALRVGEHFNGDPVGFGRPVVERLRWFHEGTALDLTERLPQRLDRDSVALRLDRPGGHLFALDTRPFFATLPADAFNAYLREEGLERVLRLREYAGTGDRPGRERYRRHVKSLLHVGTADTSTLTQRTGQTLEIVPAADPRTLRPGDALRLVVLFRGQPLEGALVKLWNHKDVQLNVLRTRTDAQGMSSTVLPWPGVWMASVVHMVPVTDDPAWDWDSHWGNVTFEVGDGDGPGGPIGEATGRPLVSGRSATAASGHPSGAACSRVRRRAACASTPWPIGAWAWHSLAT